MICIGLVLILLELGLVHHDDGFGGTFFGADAAALTVFEVDSGRDGPCYNDIRAVEPAQETGFGLALCRDAEFDLDHGAHNTPGPGYSTVTRAGFTV